MKKIVGYFSIGLLLSSLFLSCTNSDVTLFMNTTGKPKSVHLTSMFNETNGISVGFSGMVAYTNDGGTTWEKGTNNSMCLFSMEYLDENNCVAGGNLGTLIKTMDGGKNWEKFIGVPQKKIKAISFKSFEKGWIASGFEAYQTTDEGQTWVEISRPKDLQFIETVYMIDDGKGFICSSEGDIFFTEDTGKNWTTCGNLFSASKDKFQIKQLQDKQQMAMTFINDVGLIECIGVNNKHEIQLRTFKSLDKGLTWSESSSRPLPQDAVGINICMAKNISLTNYDSTSTVFTFNQ